MGFVSYFEDIRERLSGQVRDMRDEIAQMSTASSAISLDKAQAIQRTCEAFVKRLDGFMEVATDPGFDLAANYQKLTEDMDRLRMDFALLEKDRASEHDGRMRAEERLKTVEADMAAARQEIEQLRRDMEDDALRKRRERLEKRVALLSDSNTRKDREIHHLKATLVKKDRIRQELKDFAADPASFYDQYPPTSGVRR